eukprot:scaffold14405_cov83-Skeletonema_dohrnii-CCMP3373.AAC.1
MNGRRAVALRFFVAGVEACKLRVDISMRPSFRLILNGKYICTANKNAQLDCFKRRWAGTYIASKDKMYIITRRASAATCYMIAPRDPLSRCRRTNAWVPVVCNYSVQIPQPGVCYGPLACILYVASDGVADWMLENCNITINDE